MVFLILPTYLEVHIFLNRHGGICAGSQFQVTSYYITEGKSHGIKSRAERNEYTQAWPSPYLNVQLNFSTLTQSMAPCLGNGAACLGLPSPTLVTTKSVHVMSHFNYELDTTYNALGRESQICIRLALGMSMGH